MNSRYALYLAFAISLVVCLYALYVQLPLMPLMSSLAFALIAYTVVREKRDRKHLNSIVSFLQQKRSPNERYFIDEGSHNKALVIEINRLIEELQETHIRALQTEQARKQLLSNISHDIRTPLTSIIGYIDALKDEVIQDEAEKKAYLEILADKSERLKNLIEDIFQLAKLDADDLPLRIEKLDMNEVIRETLIGFIPLFDAKDMALINEISEEEVLIYADYISLKRILENILKNSIAHGQSGKFIRVKTFHQGAKYRCVISDKGPGIDPENQNYIFDRLFKGSDTRDKRYESSGLGLSIAQKLTTAMKGKIGVYTGHEEETCFFIDLPKVPKKELM